MQIDQRIFSHASTALRLGAKLRILALAAVGATGGCTIAGFPGNYPPQPYGGSYPVANPYYAPPQVFYPTPEPIYPLGPLDYARRKVEVDRFGGVRVKNCPVFGHCYR